MSSCMITLIVHEHKQRISLRGLSPVPSAGMGYHIFRLSLSTLEDHLLGLGISVVTGQAEMEKMSKKQLHIGSCSQL